MSLALKNPFGIRSKLVFLSSFLLVIPWLGYQYILGMEDYLRAVRSKLSWELHRRWLPR